MIEREVRRHDDVPRPLNLPPRSLPLQVKRLSGNVRE
jgi:hypothetical protein